VKTTIIFKLGENCKSPFLKKSIPFLNFIEP
jgi:hypothetical protein